MKEKKFHDKNGRSSSCFFILFLGTDLRVGWLDKILVTVVSVNLSFLVYDPRISVKKNLVILELTVSESRSLWYCILTFYDWLDNLTPLS